MQPTINIENLGFDMGAHLLVKQGLSNIAVGEELSVIGQAPDWQGQLASWCRDQGHQLSFIIKEGSSIAKIRRGSTDSDRWKFAENTGSQATKNKAIAQDHAKPQWGLAARGATVEAGAPEFQFRFSHKSEIWSNLAGDLYTQALAAQWDPEKAIDWSTPQQHSPELERAVVQVMTYMIENENAALIVPARFLGQLHPHFREVQALLAIQVADEARHIEVFTRRIHLYGQRPALSTAGGQASLKTLLDEPDFSIAAFLLSVLGEGTFVDLLQFLHQYGPDSVTRQICMLAGRDESRHVAFGMSHLREHLEHDTDLRGRLARATEERFESLAKTSGLNQEVFDSLLIIAAGDLSVSGVAKGFSRVQELLLTMEQGRRSRLQKLGFSSNEAHRLSSLHTRNFM